MSDVDGPPNKRLRFERSSKSTKTAQKQTRYLLRSRAKVGEIVIGDIKLTEPQRQRKRIGKLMQLNDDCLLALFERMDPNTMCNVAETCHRLNELARYHFRIKYSKFDSASLISEGIVAYDMATTFFRNFGDLITSLNLVCNLFHQTENISYELLKLVMRNCIQLKTLIIEDFTITRKQLHKLRPLFQPIEKLVLENCAFNECRHLGDMKNLKTLKIKDVECCFHEMFGRCFSKLEEIELEDLIEFFGDNTVKNMIKANVNLKRLSITNCFDVTTATFSAIQQLRDLVEFEFQCNHFGLIEAFRIDVQKLALLNNLKVLKLSCNKCSVAQLLAAFDTNGIRIEHLELAHGLLDKSTYENINKLKSIKILKLNDMAELKEYHVLGFARELNRLETLCVKTITNITRLGLRTMIRDANRLSCLKIDSPIFSLDTNTYRTLLTTIQKREQHIKLDVTIYGDGNQLLVPHDISRGTNEKWISVKELNRHINHIFHHGYNRDEDAFLLDDFGDDEGDDDDDDDDDEDDDDMGESDDEPYETDEFDMEGIEHLLPIFELL